MHHCLTLRISLAFPQNHHFYHWFLESLDYFDFGLQFPKYYFWKSAFVISSQVSICFDAFSAFCSASQLSKLYHCFSCLGFLSSVSRNWSNCRLLSSSLMILRCDIRMNFFSFLMGSCSPYLWWKILCFPLNFHFGDSSCSFENSYFAPGCPKFDHQWVS